MFCHAEGEFVLGVGWFAEEVGTFLLPGFDRVREIQCVASYLA